ncbi:hypothetical protein G6F19_007837 [Rhizopus arrhizus]|nr:hypothetical protein G6F19_007837 [Rhizopus arrhizus]KAG0881286.1 hypothetical protein G6F15_007848 [Rhizopus arrhizus]
MLGNPKQHRDIMRDYVIKCWYKQDPVTQHNVACPVLCVSDQWLCPESIGPNSCPPGQSLCPDGTCAALCSPSRNPCSCPSNPSLNSLKSCNRMLIIKTDIPDYHPENATAQTYEACSRTLNMNHTLSATWAGTTQQAQNEIIWNVCSAPVGMSFPTQATLVHHANVANEVIREKVDDPSETEETKDESEELIQKGFKDDWVGWIMMSYMSALSVFWIIVLLVLSLDYYGYVTGTPFGLFYDSYDLSSKAFCLAWFLSTSWYLAINLLRSKIRDHFRILTDLDRCSHVQVQKQRKVIRILHDQISDRRRPLAVLEHVVRQLLGLDTLTKTVSVQVDSQGHRYFEFQSTRYTLDFALRRFVPAVVDMSRRQVDLVRMDQGLDSMTARRRLELIGPNFIEVRVPSFLEACWQELTGFFYIYQLMILWCYFYLAYWQIGLSDTGVILLAAVIKVVVRLKSEKRVKKMAEHVDRCQVLRDGQWETISTADLVPGDVLQIVPRLTMPVDAVILKGDIVVDESSLTGEPLPIRKFPLRADVDDLFDAQSLSGKTHSLFAGTIVKQALDPVSGQPASALVLKTRTDTEKGQLVQRILFPQPVSFIFNEQLKLVFCLLLIWALVLLGFGVWWLGGTGMTAWFYGTICAAQVMNPLLPAILVVGQSIASRRLRQKSVFCVDLPRILMAGKVQVFCFDKTGTLTKEGLEYHGVYPVQNNTFEAFKDQFSLLSDLLKTGLSSCHSVTRLDGQYIGNPVDIVLFETTQAELTSKKDITTADGIRLQVIQQHEFQHARASMSVVVKDLETGHVHLFCKGSFETLATLSSQVPSDFHELSSQKAREGCYVLAMAHRDLGVLSEEEEAEVVNRWTRDRLESDMQLIGLLLLKNQLRPDTTEAIAQLKQGDVRTVMITGDNALTGICIGQQCRLVPDQASVILGDLNEADTLVWTEVETGSIVKDVDAELATDERTELALTGPAFRWLVDQGSIQEYLFRTRVFARMTPVDKMKCVELWMERAITAMCGDGGNDCGALRSAHVGMAMSEAEASVVSPFSTPRRSIGACVDLVIQGRSALATSFASYKYLIMYGETMATVKFCTFYYTMSFSQWNFILIDAFITVFCSFAVTQAGAARSLSVHRPTARILGPEVLLSVLGQLWINMWFLVGAFVWLYTKDDFFRCHEWDARAIDSSKWWLLGDSFEADILTFTALYQFINSAFIFNYGYIFRQRWYRNYFLIFVWILFIAIVSYWELADPNSFGCLMRVNCGNPDVLVSLGYPRPDFYIEPYNNPLGHNVLPRYFRYQLWAYSICNMVAVNIWERFFILGPIRQWLRRQYPLKKLEMKL